MKSKTENQSKVWNNIAKEWFEFKTSPAQHVKEFLKNKSGNILDLGSGAGRHLMNLNTKKITTKTIGRGRLGLGGGGLTQKQNPISETKMYLVDFSKEMIKLAKQKAKKENIEAEFAVASMEKLPFENNFFDAAIATASFHCLPKKLHMKAAKELFRVLKKNAEAEICVWNKQMKRFKNAPKEKMIGWRDKGKRYYYLFDANEIYKLFKDAGFKIISRESPRRNIIFVVKKP